jgi:hypothetical protein
MRSTRLRPRLEGLDRRHRPEKHHRSASLTESVTFDMTVAG